jgi:hypothetical protein
MAACSAKAARSDRPLPEAVVGDWDELCRWTDKTKTNCLGDDGERRRMHVAADGALERVNEDGEVMRGTWTATPTTFVMHFDIANTRVDDDNRASIVDGRLVLLSHIDSFSVIYRRHGDDVEFLPTTVTTGAPMTSTIGKVTYRFQLPPGYRLIDDDNGEQKWAPPGGDGLVVEIFARQPHTPGESCEPREGGGSRGIHGGPMQETDVSLSMCAGDMSLFCMVTHSRGHLEPDDKQPARALCKTVSAKP